jgi:hypothetical protein
MEGTFIYTNGMGIKKRVVITKLNDNQFYWRGVNLSNGECCFNIVLSQEEHEDTFNTFQKSYKDFIKIT